MITPYKINADLEDILGVKEANTMLAKVESETIRHFECYKPDEIRSQEVRIQFYERLTRSLVEQLRGYRSELDIYKQLNLTQAELIMGQEKELDPKQTDLGDLL